MLLSSLHKVLFVFCFVLVFVTRFFGTQLKAFVILLCTNVVVAICSKNNDLPTTKSEDEDGCDYASLSINEFTDLLLSLFCYHRIPTNLSIP